MQRIVTAEIDLELGSSVDLIFQIAAAHPASLSRESLTFTHTAPDGAESLLTPHEIVDPSGTRLHRLQGPAGPIAVRYEALVDGPVAAHETTDLETITYLRPSRYAQSDEVFAQARRQFRGLQGHDLIAAVSDFVATSVTYTPGISQGTDSAVTTLTTGQGVCRDYAHLVIALLRAMDMPARYAACYAPGLRPMDFHAVAEAYHDGRWYVIDATRLANRRSLVRIATGRDAADCAWLSYHGGHVGLTRMRVDAHVVPVIGGGGHDGHDGDGAADDVALASDPAHDDLGALVQIA